MFEIPRFPFPCNIQMPFCLLTGQFVPVKSNIWKDAK